MAKNILDPETFRPMCRAMLRRGDVTKPSFDEARSLVALRLPVKYLELLALVAMLEEMVKLGLINGPSTMLHENLVQHRRALLWHAAKHTVNHPELDLILGAIANRFPSRG